MGLFDNQKNSKFNDTGNDELSKNNATSQKPSSPLDKINDVKNALPQNKLKDLAMKSLMNGGNDKAKGFGGGVGQLLGLGNHDGNNKANKDGNGLGDKAKDAAKKQFLSPQNMARNARGAAYGAEGYAAAKGAELAYNGAMGLLKDFLNTPLIKAASDIAGAVEHGVASVESAAAATTSAVSHAAAGAAAGAKAAMGAVAGTVNLAINTALHAVGISATVSGMMPTVITALSLISPLTVVGYTIFNEAGISSSCSTNTSTTGSTTAAATGDWTKEGTTAYTNAKAVFDYWTSKRGFSGAAAAGIVGNIGGAEDTGFVLDQKEIGGGTGGGLYQFTPYTKYLNNSASDKSWSVENQSDVVWNLELKNNEIAKYGNKVSTTAYASETNPSQAAEDWEYGYERPSASARTLTLGNRQAAAQAAYILFSGSSFGVNTSLLGQDTSTVVSNGSTVDTDANSSSSCSTDTSSSSDSADGTGSVSELGVWKPSDVPADVKKYIHDPAAAGLTYGSATGWYNPGDQCVHFASSYFYLIWGLTDKLMVPSGADETSYWAKALGGSPTATPSAGAIASVPGNTPSEGPSSDGHTFVVEHVLANGDIIVAEQNYNVYSGSRMGEADTWDFRIITKATYTSDNFTFYTPSSGKLNWGSNS